MYKKKILLVKPYTGRKKSAVAPPLGLMYLSSYLRSTSDNEYDIKLIDMRLDKLKVCRLLDIVKDFSPDIVGISVCSEEDEKLHEIASGIKALSENVMVVAGGPHATVYYSEVLKDRNIDIAVIGEGEITFSELMACIEKKTSFYEIPGIAFSKDSRIIKTIPRNFIKNLDDLPFPAWDLIDISRYSSSKLINMNVFLSGRRYMGIITSRGCPYSCIYCHDIFGKDFRKRSPENIFKEVDILVKEYGIDEFHIFDDIFNLDSERVNKITGMIIDSGLDIKIAFPNGIRGDICDAELLEGLKKAGTYMITFALETASVRLQKLIKKNMSMEKLQEAISYADNLGIITKCYFMIGFPTETEQEINETIEFACASPLIFASFFIVNPHKGTRLFDLASGVCENIKIDFKDLNYYSKCDDYGSRTGISLRKVQSTAYRRFFFNPARIRKILQRIPRKVFILRNMFKFFSFFW
ncbi:B12-binding domain-containing radical SAM protein [Elusimicrobiota bacterium]